MNYLFYFKIVVRGFTVASLFYVTPYLSAQLRWFSPTPARVSPADEESLDVQEVIDYDEEESEEDGNEAGEGEETAAEPEKALKAPSPETLEAWIDQLGDTKATLRETAIRRLMPFPQAASQQIVKAFSDGNLSTRLATLELLREWKAPIDDLDPWQPRTLSPERLAALMEWQEETLQTASATLPMASRTLTPEQEDEAAEEIARLAAASDSEAEAIRERLARWGTALLPRVYERLKTTTTDRQRQQLQALRYRLVAGESLSERWPGGLSNLASPDTAQRRKSAEEFANLAIAEDRLLLRELFGDPDPLVREISLRGMQKIGTETQSMLLDLLADPDPNVRAAVLKQLEENPPRGTSAKITEYVKTENDADLVGHAVRVLRKLHENEDTKASRCLIELLKHDSWQIRADAVAALGKNNRYHSSYDTGKLNPKEQLQVDIYVAMIELLKDEDSFVVGKTVEGLKNVRMPAAVEPLVDVIRRFPELAVHVIPALTGNNAMQTKAMPHLLVLAKHDDPRIRAAVLNGITDLQEDFIIAGLNDSDTQVRIVAASALFRNLDAMRNNAINNDDSSDSDIRPPVAPTPQVAVLSGFARLFSKSKKSKDSEADAEVMPLPSSGTVDFDDEPQSEEATVAESSSQDTTSTERANEDEVLQRLISSKSSMAASDEYDLWLTNFQAGQERPEWTNGVIEPLEKMLTAESLQERAAAAKSLAPLGRSSEMASLLLGLSHENPELSDSFFSVAPWLVREKRMELFLQLQKPSTPIELQQYRLINSFFEPPDLRNEPLLWGMLEGEVSDELLDGIHTALCQLYLVERHSYYDDESDLPPKKVRAKLAEKLLPRVETGSDYQRLLALAMLVAVDPEKAKEAARKIDADATLDDKIRFDAFQVLLLLQKTEKAKVQFVLDTLQQKDPKRSGLAVRALVGDPYDLRLLRGGIYLPVNAMYHISDVQEGVKTLPKGLELDSIKPLIDDENEEVAAYAGYFTAMLGDPDGMTPLLKYWRQTKGTNETVGVLLYNAIATLDDPQYIPQLREIYAKLDSSDVRNFYWAIRSMTGPEILKFRKEIRDTHGMENLR